MANRNTQGFPSPEEDPRFHDTYQFLRRYRDATYSLKVVVHQMEHQFKLQYDNDIDKFLDSIYAAGADLTGSDIEQRAKSIARSNQMLKLLESSIDLLRNNHKHGDISILLYKLVVAWNTSIMLCNSSYVRLCKCCRTSLEQRNAACILGSDIVALDQVIPACSLISCQCSVCFVVQLVKLIT